MLFHTALSVAMLLKLKIQIVTTKEYFLALLHYRKGKKFANTELIYILTYVFHLNY